MIGGDRVMRTRQILAFDEAGLAGEAADVICGLRDLTEPDPVILDRAPSALSEQSRASGKTHHLPNALSQTVCVQAPSGFLVITGSDIPDINSVTVRV